MTDFRRERLTQRCRRNPRANRTRLCFRRNPEQGGAWSAGGTLTFFASIQNDVIGWLTVLVMDPLGPQRVLVDEGVSRVVHVHVVGRFHVAADKLAPHLGRPSKLTAPGMTDTQPRSGRQPARSGPLNHSDRDRGGSLRLRTCRGEVISGNPRSASAFVSALPPWANDQCRQGSRLLPPAHARRASHPRPGR